MNVTALRAELAARDRTVAEVFDELGKQIQSGSFSDEKALWNNSNLVRCQPSDERSAYVIFPDIVHLLPTSALFNRVYVHLQSSDRWTFDAIDGEPSFRKCYQMGTADFVELVRAGRVVPILSLHVARYSDYLLEKVVFPILTNELSFMTFAGHALICQIWQASCGAFPDPKANSWGFLMDLCSAIGIGANFVRPEYQGDVWDRRNLIFSYLGFDEVASTFLNRDFTLDDFFVASGISFDSRHPVKDYLTAFENVDREKIFALYNALDKHSYLTEIEKLNGELRLATKRLNREQLFLSISSAPVALLFFCAGHVLQVVCGREFVKAMGSMTDSSLKVVLEKARTAFQKQLLKAVDWHKRWLNGRAFPQVIELARLRRLLPSSR